MPSQLQLGLSSTWSVQLLRSLPSKTMAVERHGRQRLTVEEQIFALNFLAPPEGETDTWRVMEGKWLVRVHARARTMFFHPCHESNPVDVHQLRTRRLTVIFEMRENEWVHRVVLPDTWSQFEQQSYGVKWKGYTLFSGDANLTEQQPVNETQSGNNLLMITE